MKKLLFHLGALGRGGAERVTVNLARQFRGDSYEVVFVTATRKNPEYPADGFKRIVLDETCTTRGVLRNPAMKKTLVGVIKAEKLGKNAAESAERFKSETVYRQWKEFLLSKCG